MIETKPFLLQKEGVNQMVMIHKIGPNRIVNPKDGGLSTQMVYIVLTAICWENCILITCLRLHVALVWIKIKYCPQNSAKVKLAHNLGAFRITSYTWGCYHMITNFIKYYVEGPFALHMQHSPEVFQVVLLAWTLKDYSYGKGDLLAHALIAICMGNT